MRIALDAMGGDFAPSETVAGAVQAVRQQSDLRVVLVGQRAVLEAELAKHEAAGLPLEVFDAPGVIAMDEMPTAAVRAKPDASIVVAMELLRAGQVDGLATVGHTGAALVAAAMVLGRIEGIRRPTVGVPVLGIQAGTFFWDAGTNVDCKPIHLLQFAVMGTIYVRRVVGVANPRVGLLSNGAEDNKGDSLLQATFPLLAASDLNFVGNIEGFDLARGRVEVVVCDGLVGNVVLKYTEGLSNVMLDLVEQEIGARLPAEVRREVFEPAMADLRRRSDYAEVGAMPLLGVDGTVVIGHGRSRAKAVTSAIYQARRAAEADLVTAIREEWRSLARLPDED